MTSAAPALETGFLVRLVRLESRHGTGEYLLTRSPSGWRVEHRAHLHDLPAWIGDAAELTEAVRLCERDEALTLAPDSLSPHDISF